MEQITTEDEIEEINSSIEHDDEKEETTCYCPRCKSTNIYGVSRVVGYFSVIENWNKSKRAELKRRQKGSYWYKEEE